MIAGLVLTIALSGEPLLVPGTTMTWTDGADIWAGNPYCKEAGALLAPDSPAVDAADKGCRHVDTYLLECSTGPNESVTGPIQIPTFFCPLPGSAKGQPPLPEPYNLLQPDWNGSCREWYGAAPDIGACEYVPALVVDSVPAEPMTLEVK